MQYLPHKDVEGNVMGWFASIMGLAGRMHAGAALRESEERSHLAQSMLAAIVESSSDAIVSMDLNGIIMSWNAGAEQILGYKEEEIVGRSVFDLVPPNIHIEEVQILERLRHGERVEPFDTIRIRKGGEQVHVSLSISPVRDSLGNIVGSSKIARDITERQRVQDALRESEGRFRHLILSLPVALYTTDTEGRITLFNEPAAQLWGRRPEIGETLRSGSWRIYRPDGTPLDYDDSPMAVSLRQNRPIRGEEIILERPDGTRTCVLPHLEPMRDAAGQPTGAVNMLVDITDRRRAEEVLQESHDELEVRVRNRTMDLLKANEELQERDLQLSTAQQIAHFGSWAWDLRTSVVTWSEQLYQIYGVPNGAFDQTLASFLEHVHPGDRDTTTTNLQTAIRTHQPFDFEERIIRPDGTIRFLHTQGKVVTDEHDGVTGLLGVCLDVTDRKQADKRFRDLLESAPDAVVIVNNEGRIIIVNAQTERLFGYRRTELLGQHLEILLPERFHHKHEGHRANYFLAPHSRSMGQGLELFGLRKDKSEFPVEISLSPIETDEGILVTSSIRDITQQKRMQEELLAFERTRFSELRRFARSAQHAQEEERLRIARELHDGICQTLSGMKLKAESLEEDAAIIDKAFASKLQNFNRQYELVIDEVRRMSTNLRPAALDDFGFGVAVSLLANDFKKTNKVSVNLTVDEPILLDPQTEIALFRITQESLTNIAKHADATHVNITLSRSEWLIMLEINDDGKGFNPAEGSIRKDPYHGFGLVGMRDRTDMLGGTFRLESACGQGTTITITIPRNEKEGR